MHPATLYSFTIGVIALIGTIVLLALHDIPVEAALPIISAIALGGIGAGAGIQQSTNTTDAGTTGPGA